MPENESLPIEVGLEKAKVDIVNAVGDIGSKYSLPASWMLMILENIVSESKLNTFQNVIVKYDFSNPAANDRLVIPTPEPVPDRLPTQAPVKIDEEKTDGRDKKPVK